MSEVNITKTVRRRRSPYDTPDPEKQTKCQRCSVWRNKEEFQQRGRSFVNCNQCRLYRRNNYKLKIQAVDNINTTNVSQEGTVI